MLGTSLSSGNTSPTQGWSAQNFHPPQGAHTVGWGKQILSLDREAVERRDGLVLVGWVLSIYQLSPGLQISYDALGWGLGLRHKCSVTLSQATDRASQPYIIWLWSLLQLHPPLCACLQILPCLFPSGPQHRLLLPGMPRPNYSS